MGRRVLICDDAIFMRRILKDILTKENYEVVGEAEDGRDAIEKVQMLQPDLVLLDITMPQMNGVEALREIKRIDEAVKVIMCSALGQKSMIIDCLKEGALDFIVKPFEEARVLEAIANALG